MGSGSGSCSISGAGLRSGFGFSTFRVLGFGFAKRKKGWPRVCEKGEGLRLGFGIFGFGVRSLKKVPVFGGILCRFRGEERPAVAISGMGLSPNFGFWLLGFGF